MDRFIFHNSQYKILDTVRDMPWVGVPLPFAECIFYFADMGLQVSTAVCKSRTCLSMCFAMISDGKPVVFASVNAALNNGRWPRQIDLSFVSGRGAPPESIYEFIRFYQRLSIYVPKSVVLLGILCKAATTHSIGVGPVNCSPKRPVRKSLLPTLEKTTHPSLEVQPVCLTDPA